ncbi:AIPR family protein [Halomontanus rarus]|uniref:AIPR family protein n=1 Tax=Halomontanus rarus TaxID=3034020 RepID=UPI0023E87936|nr:AIPR family protein [Halovivax sp. TS33]
MAKSTEGQSPLPEPDTPCSIELEYVKKAEVDNKDITFDYPIHHFYVRCSDLQRIELPLDANPREPTITTQVKAMRETLQGDPKEFVNRNNGIVILASNVQAEGGELELKFEEGEGICNGGHTLLAIREYTDNEDAIAHLEVIEIKETVATEKKRQQEIADIANARNNNNQLEERSQADFLGYYDSFKDVLIDPRIVRWREGDSDAIGEAINAYHFLRMMKALDVSDYGHPLYDERGKNHSSLATSVTRIHNRWKSEMDDWMMDERESRPLQYLTPLATDLFYIRDLVSHHLKHTEYPRGTRRMSIFQKYIMSSDRDLLFGNFKSSTGYNITPPFEILMIGLYRTNLYMSLDKPEKTELIGWFREPAELWSQRSLAVLNSLQNDFKDASNDPKKFIRLNGPFSHDFYKHGMNAEISEEPAVIYDVKTGMRYLHTEDEEKATHSLVINRNPSEKDQLIDEIVDSNEIALYMEQSVKSAYKFRY